MQFRKSSTIQEKIKRLPELPVEQFEVAGKLGFSDKTPVITIRPHKFRAPRRPRPKKPSTRLDERKSTFTKNKYYVMVTYPRLVCQPPPRPQSETARVQPQMATLFKEDWRENKYESTLSESNIESISKKVWYYKLTKLNGVGLFEPYWCSVKYGPWSAIVEETESCIPHAPALWSLYIAEMPEVTMSWYGQWSDIPSYPSLSNARTQFQHNIVKD